MTVSTRLLDADGSQPKLSIDARCNLQPFVVDGHALLMAFPKRRLGVMVPCLALSVTLGSTTLFIGGVLLLEQWKRYLLISL